MMQRRLVLNGNPVENVVGFSCAGSRSQDVVPTRLLLTDVDNRKPVVDVRKAFCRAANPVDTSVQVTRFVNPEWLAELEVDAVVLKA